jgi:16S rRNA (guanine1207-N2)-methyltransferase
MVPPLAAASDARIDALFLPLQSGELRVPGGSRVLFLRARDDARLREFAGPDWLCQQSFKPFADRLHDAGVAVGEPGEDERFALVMVLPPRQRDEARALFARAAHHVQAGGSVLAAMPNAEGAKSAEADFSRLFGPVRSLSRRKCRVFHARVDAPLAAEPLAQWTSLDAPRRTSAGYLSRAGLFAWDRVDAASALLAAHLPGDLCGQVADLGAGYGYLATQVVARCPHVTAIDLYEAEARALEVAQVNVTDAVAASGREVAVRLHWHDVTAGLAQRYDAIVSNPPFHQGRADLPELGRAFIASAAAALQPRGRLWLVANRHLPYEATLAALFAQVRTVVVQDGFKVIEATRA